MLHMKMNMNDEQCRGICIDRPGITWTECQCARGPFNFRFLDVVTFQFTPMAMHSFTRHSFCAAC